MNNIAVIGSGGWGLNIIKNMAALGALGAVCDINKTNFEKIKNDYPDIILTTNLKHILKDKDINGAVIATPPLTHFKLAKKVLQADKNVWVEKPVTLKSKDAKALSELSDKKNKIILVGHILLYHPAYGKLKELIKENYLGEIYHVISKRLGFGKVRKNENVLWSLGVHDVAAALYLTGKKARSVSCAGVCRIQKDVEDIVYVNIEFEDGVTASINSSWLHPYRERKTIIIGSERSAVIDELDKEAPLKIYNQKIVKIPVQDLKEEYFPMNKEDTEVVKFEDTDMLKEECIHFIDCISSGKKPKTDIKNGEEVIRILETCEKSIKKQGTGIKVAIR